MKKLKEGIQKIDFLLKPWYTKDLKLRRPHLMKKHLAQALESNKNPHVVSFFVNCSFINSPHYFQLFSSETSTIKLLPQLTVALLLAHTR
jgi:hypothetical protein